jgi:two-component system chemotaxis response regulator CheB
MKYQILLAEAMMIKVLIIDDSMIVRQLLTKVISKQPGFEVIGSVANPYKAIDLMKTKTPDVITLDVEMPRMNGIEFMEKLNKFGFFRVLMISSLTEKGATVTLEALAKGALDYVFKPLTGSQQEMAEYEREVVEKLTACAKSGKMVRDTQLSSDDLDSYLSKTDVAQTADVIMPLTKKEVPFTRSKIIAIGSSTGGTEAIKDVLAGLDGNVPGIVVAQHMPKDFTKAFAKRLNKISRVNVKEAEDGDMILPGHVYIAPGDRHLVIKRVNNNYICKLVGGGPVMRHMPSCDVLLRSVSNVAAQNAIGIILTGMGADGAKGLLEMRNRGAKTIAQSQKDCVVFGMPREAIKIGAAEQQSTLRQMPEIIMDYIIELEKDNEN